MTKPTGSRSRPVASTRERQRLLADVLAGLEASPRTLPCKYFYDARGSRLFDRICGQPEYYLTRTELAIMRRHGPQMAAALGAPVVLVEYGSGSSVKTGLLLRHLEPPSVHVPVDISGEHLRAAAARLAERFPQVRVHPVCADFTRPFELPGDLPAAARRVVYFPGSTLGNFGTAEAGRLLGGMRRMAGAAGGLLIGLDLQKDRSVLLAAYNDAAGVTAAFNRNLLVRLNRELGADFDPDGFEHRAVYNEGAHRIEMHLVSRRRQTVVLGGRVLEFPAGESICTEHSHKYSLDGFRRQAAAAGFDLRTCWTDERRWFAVLYLEAAG